MSVFWLYPDVPENGRFSFLQAWGLIPLNSAYCAVFMCDKGGVSHRFLHTQGNFKSYMMDEFRFSVKFKWDY